MIFCLWLIYLNCERFFIIFFKMMLLCLSYAFCMIEESLSFTVFTSAQWWKIVLLIGAFVFSFLASISTATLTIINMLLLLLLHHHLLLLLLLLLVIIIIIIICLLVLVEVVVVGILIAIKDVEWLLKRIISFTVGESL